MSTRSFEERAVLALERHVEAINSGDKETALHNLVAAAAFPRPTQLYWERALECRPLVVRRLVARPVIERTRNGLKEFRVVVEGQLSVADGKSAEFRFSVLFRPGEATARIAGRLPVRSLEYRRN